MSKQQNTPDVSAIDDYELQALKDFDRLRKYSLREPAIVLSTLYLITSLAGFLHLFFLLERFNVDVLPHLELTDFLLGAIYYPTMFLYFIGFILLALVCFYMDRLCRHKFAAYARLSLKHYDQLYNFRLSTMIGILVAIYIFVSADLEAANNHTRLISDTEIGYTLHMAEPTLLGEEKRTHLPDVRLIANLSKYLWVYDPAHQATYAIPIDSVVALEVQPEAKQ